MTAPADPATLETWLPLPADVPGSPGSHGARLAAAQLVRRARPDLFDATTVPPTVPTDAAVIYGGQLLTARLWARRGSPAGIATFGEFGPGAILRLDPDVERLLGVGRYAPPRVG